MKRTICVIILFIFLLVMYARYIEPTSFTVYEYSVHNNNIPTNFDGLKIVHFSDILFQNNENKSFVEKTIKEMSELNADVIIFTGDLIQKKINQENQEEIINLLSSLKANLYKYAILGDRDNNNVKTILEKSNFIILDNSSTLLFNEGTEPILIAGGDNLTDEILIKDENVTYNYKIALIHEPDYFDSIKNDYNLVLAGHSLGGQIRLPYIGSTIKKDGATKYTDRTYHENDNYLYVSFGIGTEKPNFRLFNKPSVNVYRLYSQ